MLTATRGIEHRVDTTGAHGRVASAVTVMEARRELTVETFERRAQLGGLSFELFALLAEAFIALVGGLQAPEDSVELALAVAKPLGQHLWVADAASGAERASELVDPRVSPSIRGWPVAHAQLRPAFVAVAVRTPAVSACLTTAFTSSARGCMGPGGAPSRVGEA